MGDRRSQYVPDAVSPPGETLAELLQEKGISQREMASRMGRPTKTLNEIIKGKASITEETALQLERVLGVEAAFWLARESQYRENQARKSELADLMAWSPWLAELPLRPMKRLGWIPDTRNKAELVRACLQFFGFASPEQWATYHEKLGGSFRLQSPERASKGAIAAWLRAGELAARRIECAEYNADRFREALQAIRELTVEEPARFCPEMEAHCARAGVVLLFVPELPRAGVSGVARWLAPKKGLIQLSLFGKKNDRFWFSFFHEACHILKHAKSAIFLDDLGSQAGSSPEEIEADRFAADFLIPPSAMIELRQFAVRHAHFSAVYIEAFARQVGVHPGIVVGRLQFEKLLPPTHLNGLRSTFTWTESH